MTVCCIDATVSFQQRVGDQGPRASGVIMNKGSSRYAPEMGKGGNLTNVSTKLQMTIFFLNHIALFQHCVCPEYDYFKKVLASVTNM